ncbi:sugar kinase [Pseudonocardia nematodicida]|uniref:Sugar kinase n=1 Tax=Pseudonocardia nematodicida TaxID=1206997 RepID=A0ABV1K883_9PSEU
MTPPRSGDPTDTARIDTSRIDTARIDTARIDTARIDTAPIDALCIGESMILVAPVRPEPLEHAGEFSLQVGGAESTVALYLAERGHRTAWLSRVGDDALGRRMVASVGGQGVDTSGVRIVGSAPTGVYFKDPGPTGTGVLYYRAGSAASGMDPTDLDDVDWERLRLVHVSGITAALSPGCRDLLDVAFTLAGRHGVPVSFDVNHRPGLWSAETAAPVLAGFARRADLVFVGRDEAETLWGTGEPAALAELLGPAGRLIVKDGAVGATEVAPDTGTTFVPARQVDVVEVVGAGDAFAAGYLSGLLRGDDVERRLRAGHDLAARALSSTHDFLPV